MRFSNSSGLLRRTLPLFATAAVFALAGCAETAKTAPCKAVCRAKPAAEARMDWWREARFGMFIHWGVYAVPAGEYDGWRSNHIGEWLMHDAKIPVERYREYAKQFNPTDYDPDAWVKLAKEAGMKYMIITSKHHDGFALFDSKASDWDVVDATPYGKDLLAPLAEACRKYDMKLGFYYSQAQDWTNPGGACAGGTWDEAQKGSFDEYITNLVVPQVREILTNYGDVAVIWWDTPFEMEKKHADEILEVVNELNGKVVMNNRLGGGFAGDTETPEQHIPATGFKDRDWETCMTMNDTWGFKHFDHNWKTTETLLRNLVDIAGKGGNYLLNVGPDAKGNIPAPSIERLKGIGAWMDINGESIYGTTASPFANLPWGRCTKKITDSGATLYLHVFDWPADGKLAVDGLKSKVERAYMLDGGKKLRVNKTANGIEIDLPKKAPDAIDSVVVLKIKGAIEIEKVVPRADADGVITLPAYLANIDNQFGTVVALEVKDGKQNIGYWTQSNVSVDWDFDAVKAGHYEVVVDMAMQDQNSKFTLRSGDFEKKCVVGTTGSYNSFRPANLGSVGIKSGRNKLEIIPDSSGGWHPINVRSVKLVPLD
jgi:alpha-L-fucosidase